MAEQINLQVAGADETWLMDATPHAAQDRPHAGYQLAGREGLGDVVIGAQLQADEAVGLLDAGGEHDDRHIVFGPQALADFPAIKAG